MSNQLWGRLTRRQEQIFRSLAVGRTSLQIAQELGVSVKTVHKHTERGREALGAATSTQVVAYGVACGGIPLRIGGAP
jgi:DNA-binding CsgD family transcriptional regulator